MDELERMLDMAIEGHMPDMKTQRRIRNSILGESVFDPSLIQQRTDTIFQQCFQRFSELMNQQQTES